MFNSKLKQENARLREELMTMEQVKCSLDSEMLVLALRVVVRQGGGLGDGSEQGVFIAGLFQPVHGALFDDRHGRRQLAVARQKDGFETAAAQLHGVKHLQPAHAVHAQVQQHTTRLRQVDLGQKFGSAGEGLGCVATGQQQRCQ